MDVLFRKASKTFPLCLCSICERENKKIMPQGDGQLRNYQPKKRKDIFFFYSLKIEDSQSEAGKSAIETRIQRENTRKIEHRFW
jgi:hypothetical protein